MATIPANLDINWDCKGGVDPLYKVRRDSVESKLLSVHFRARQSLAPPSLA